MVKPFRTRDPNDAVRATWLVYRKPGCVPVAKTPFPSVDEMLRELVRLYPDAQIMVCQHTHFDDLWVEDGREYLRADEIGHAYALDRKERKCLKFFAMFKPPALNADDARIDAFSDDRGRLPDTINLLIKRGILKQRRYDVDAAVVELTEKGAAILEILQGRR